MTEVRMETLKGYGCVVLAAVMWASSGTAGKGLFEGGMTPFELVQIRVTLSTVLMAAAFALFCPGVMKIRFMDLGYFALLGGCAMALVQITYFFAISKIQVAAAILLQYMAPALIGLFSICFWKERLTFTKISALILAFGGCYLVVGGYNLAFLQMNRLGIIGGLAAAVCFAGYTLLGERGMHRYGPWTVLFYAIAFAALSWNIFFSPSHYLSGKYSLQQWGWIFYISLIGTIVPFGFYFVGINYIRSTRASITATLEPISAGLMAFFILGERMEPLQILGGVLVVAAVILLQLQREQDEMAPARIRGSG
ncbi:MAG: EamA family transporter [Deltaproteobacteria bacterium]|nr:EamA family transporter [Deltaproteobacteria bacterium]MBW2018137.1 EamA family transporter [Deltaproteobacteria bacterium]MBW2129132.1 EamA family transporter [Deltaproteobacteria bacterium]MBW2302450.1 EamA family transporter [Deltaproteobacteria bacterium]